MTNSSSPSEAAQAEPAEPTLEVAVAEPTAPAEAQPPSPDEIVAKLRAYVAFTASVSLYPPTFEAFCYGLGLSGEAGEVAEVVLLRATRQIDDVEFRTRMRKELGDVCWYLFRSADLYSIDLPKILTTTAVTGMLTMGQASGELLNLQLCAHAGRAADLIKKYARDSEGWDIAKTLAWREKLIDALLRTAVATSQVGLTVGAGLLELVSENEVHLRGRKARNVLQGSGDNR